MRTLIALVIAAVFATGCKKRAESPPPAPAPAPAPATSQAEPQPIKIEAHKAPVIKVLELGHEPRAPLRYKLAGAWSGKMRMTMDMDMESRGQTVDNPTSEFVMAVRAQSAAGGIKLDCVFEDVTLAGGSEAARKMTGDILKKMKGIAMEMTMSDRGHISQMDIRYPEGAPEVLKQTLDSMKNSMGNLTAPLPEEAIGKGARWEATSSVTTQNITMDQVATFELVDRTGDVVKLEVLLKQRAAPQTMKLATGEAKILKLDGTMEGLSEISLARPFPTMEMSGSSEVEMVAGGQNIAMKFLVKIGMKEINPKNPRL